MSEFPLKEGTGEEPRNHPLMLFHLLEMALISDWFHWKEEEKNKVVAKKIKAMQEELTAMRQKYTKMSF